MITSTNMFYLTDIVCLFVCLFGVCRPTLEFFNHLETPPLPVKVFKSLTFAQHLWPLSSEGS